MRWEASRHRTDCAVALEFDRTPIALRADYEPGRRYAWITWDFPVRFMGNYRVNVELDPIGIIKARKAEYDRFELDGYAEWEKPMAFIAHLITEELDHGVWFGMRLSTDHSYMDDLHEDHWTEDDTERLDAVLAAIPDPNQGVLDLTGPWQPSTNPVVPQVSESIWPAWLRRLWRRREGP